MTAYSPTYKLLRYLMSNTSRYAFLGKGCTREVFLCPSQKSVVKICWGDNNLTEYQNYRNQFNKKQNPSGMKIAGCWWGKLRGVRVLYMEKVTPICTPEEFTRYGGYGETLSSLRKIYKDVPDWIHAIDCFQVGYNAKKELVAFDAGDYNFRFGI